VAIVIGVFIGCAVFIAMGFHLFANAKLFGVAREGFRAFREVPAQTRHRTYRMMATTYLGTLGYVVFLIVAPFGRRDTIIWFLVVPFLIVVPLGTVAAAVRGYRLGRRPSRDGSHVRPPKGERTPYKYGGSLGWVASMMDPATSSWKPSSPPKGTGAEADKVESDAGDESSP